MREKEREREREKVGGRKRERGQMLKLLFDLLTGGDHWGCLYGGGGTSGEEQYSCRVCLQPSLRHDVLQQAGPAAQEERRGRRSNSSKFADAYH